VGENIISYSSESRGTSTGRH